MVKLNESAIKTVNADERKWLFALPKRQWRSEVFVSLEHLVTKVSLGRQRAPKPTHPFQIGTRKSCTAPAMEGEPQGTLMAFGGVFPVKMCEAG